MQFLLGDGDQGICGHGTPDLRLDGVLAGAQEPLDPQVLLDSLEEQLHHPPLLVEGTDRQGWQGHVVGQKDQRLARLRVPKAHAAQWLGIVPRGVLAAQRDVLVANYTLLAIRGSRTQAPGIHACLGTGHKERTARLESVEAGEIDVATIHDIEGARFDGKDVQDSCVSGRRA